MVSRAAERAALRQLCRDAFPLGPHLLDEGQETDDLFLAQLAMVDLGIEHLVQLGLAP